MSIYVNPSYVNPSYVKPATVNFLAIVQAVRDLAAASPEARYVRTVDGCHYTLGNVTNGSVGCLVGQALVRCGMSLADVAMFDMMDTSAYNVLLSLGLPQDEWLEEVQYEQDMGETWANAVNSADRLRIVGHID